MPNLLTEAEMAACPPAAHAALVRYLAGEISAEIALMHLLLAVGALNSIDRMLTETGATGREPFVRLARLAIEHGNGLEHAARLVEAGLTDAYGDDRLAAIREQYDRAVATAPEAAVALYSLGDPAILDRATAELAALLEDWGLLGADRRGPRYRLRYRPHGTGAGAPLAAHCRDRSVAGDDRRGKAPLRRYPLMSPLPSPVDATSRNSPISASIWSWRSIAFPALSEHRPRLPGSISATPAGVLRPGGNFAIFNYSYRCNLAADRADIAAYAEAAGLIVVRNGTRDLALWDGTSFLLKAPSQPRIKASVRARAS